jgi:hypothetical protein
MDAWAKLRTFSQSIIPVPGNFSHSTLIGFMERLHIRGELCQPARVIGGLRQQPIARDRPAVGFRRQARWVLRRP